MPQQRERNAGGLQTVTEKMEARQDAFPDQVAPSAPKPQIASTGLPLP
jgi:hypothetical protein